MKEKGENHAFLPDMRFQQPIFYHIAQQTERNRVEWCQRHRADDTAEKHPKHLIRVQAEQHMPDKGKQK